jgi:hypothetical protein
MVYKKELIKNWRYLPPKDPVEYIVKIHLYIEHGLNYLIFKNCKTQNEILKPTGTYRFSFKLKLCYEMGLIKDEYCYNCLIVLNKLRNKMVHKLEIEYPLLKSLLDKNAIVKNKIFLSAEFMQLKDDSEKVYFLIKDMCINTVEPLHNLIMEQYFKEQEDNED